MAKSNLDQTLFIINRFRDLSRAFSLYDEKPVKLVSKHDPSIRFTNSTTSVLKPYILAPTTIPDHGIWLIQPAMGLQGVRYWLNTRTFGKFSSFFLSFGTLFAMNDAVSSVRFAMTFLRDLIEDDHLILQCHESHLANLEGLENMLPVRIIKNEDPQDYVHVYGLNDTYGYDIIIGSSKHENPVFFGNISVIRSGDTASCIEFSLDSTLILSAITGEHAVYCLPAYDVCFPACSLFTNEFKRFAFIDFLELSVMLQLDGLKIGSRGRSRNFKQVFNELVCLSVEIGLSERVFFDLIEKCAFHETAVLRAIAPDHLFDFTEENFGALKKAYLKMRTQYAE